MAEDAGRGVLVTGASGFIGRRLCRALRAEGRRVVALNRRPAQGPWDEAVVHELGRGPVPRAALEGIDTVFHLAARAHALNEPPGTDEPYERVNVGGTRQLLEAALAAQVRRLVLFSTVKAMGELTEGCADESLPPRPESPYGRTKRAAELLVLEAGREARLEPVVLRLCAVYGPGSKGNLDRMLEQVRRGRFPPLPELGNRRSLVHVDDVVRAARLVATHPRAPGEVFIVTGREACSTRVLYETMCRALDRDPPSWSVPGWVLRAAAAGGDVVGAVLGRPVGFDSAAYARLAGSAWYSSQRLRRVLGFEPEHGLEEGLRAMLTPGGDDPGGGEVGNG